jgi:hypothetical protein
MVDNQRLKFSELVLGFDNACVRVLNTRDIDYRVIWE